MVSFGSFRNKQKSKVLVERKPLQENKENVTTNHSKRGIYEANVLI